MGSKEVIVHDCYFLEEEVYNMAKLGLTFQKAEAQPDGKIKAMFTEPTKDIRQKFYTKAITDLSEEIEKRNSLLIERREHLRILKEKLKAL